MTPRVLICFDGSEGAGQAVQAAGRIFPGAQARVAFAWRPPLPYGGISYGGQIVLPAEIQREIESNAATQAQKTAEAGARLAAEAGLHAEGQAYETSGPVWRALLAAADDIEADVIVAGSRGLGELRALMLGSISTALAHHSHIPLLIVPTHAKD